MKSLLALWYILAWFEFPQKQTLRQGLEFKHFGKWSQEKLLDTCRSGKSMGIINKVHYLVCYPWGYYCSNLLGTLWDSIKSSSKWAFYTISQGIRKMRRFIHWIPIYCWRRSGYLRPGSRRQMHRLSQGITGLKS